jgi:predicted AAA+ superfamily ATPase
MDDIIRLLNHWWRERKVKESLALQYKRESFKELSALMGKRQVIIVCGLRRVGKSTLLYQLIQQEIEKGRDPEDILYFSFDKKVDSIKAVLDKYREITERDYEKRHIIVVIDEIYKLDKWHSELKLLYDALPNIKFLVSGSASLKIEKGARNDLTGRAFYVEVKPLSYKEYFELKTKKVLEQPKVWEDSLKANFPAFLKKGFPEIIEFDKEKASEYVNDLILDKILFSDFAQTFKKVDIDLLKTLTNIFYSEPGLYLNVDNMAKDLKKSKNDLMYHIQLLELGYLIKIVKNYRGSAMSSSRKMRRVYPYHPALIQGTYREVHESKLVECFVRSHLDAETYWREGDCEVDFIHKERPIEVKYSEKIEKGDIKPLLDFMERFKVKKGYVISKHTSEKIILEKSEVQVIPAWRFALNGFENKE